MTYHYSGAPPIEDAAPGTGAASSTTTVHLDSTAPRTNLATVAAVMSLAGEAGLLVGVPCADCGRVLVSAKSLATGRGPTCRQRAEGVER